MAFLKSFIKFIIIFVLWLISFVLLGTSIELFILDSPWHNVIPSSTGLLVSLIITVPLAIYLGRKKYSIAAFKEGIQSLEKDIQKGDAKFLIKIIFIVMFILVLISLPFFFFK